MALILSASEIAAIRKKLAQFVARYGRDPTKIPGVDIVVLGEVTNDIWKWNWDTSTTRGLNRKIVRDWLAQHAPMHIKIIDGDVNLSEAMPAFTIAHICTSAHGMLYHTPVVREETVTMIGVASIGKNK